MAANAQPYPGLERVHDEATRTCLRLAFDRLNSLVGRADDPAPRRTDLDLGDHRVSNVSDPTAAQDAVTKAYADATYGALALRTALQATGDTPLNVTGLKGVLADPQRMGIRVVPDAEALPDVLTAREYEVITWKGQLYYFDPTTNPGSWVLLSAAASIVADTHANRLLNYLPANQPLGLLFWETDRVALYRILLSAGVKVWSLMLTRPMVNQVASRPADLGANDAEFLFVSTDEGNIVYLWTGTAWAYHRGRLYGTFANRPAVADCDDGFEYLTSNYGAQTYRMSGGVWVLMEGQGGPMRDTFANRPGSLGTGDAGFHFVTTDRGGAVYRWSGTAWVWVAQAEPMRGTLSPDQKPGSLGTNDTGLLFTSTDFARTYRWGGAAWVDLPGEPERYQIGLFDVAPGTGWQLCNGSTVSRSTSGGGTTNITVPDLTTAATFLRTNSVAGGTGTFAAAGSAENYYDVLPYMRL